MRALLRSLVTGGVQFVAAHPRLHRAARVVAQRVPGFRVRVQRLLPPASPPMAGVGDPNAGYLFEAGDVDDAHGVITLEQLYHLSRLI